MSPFQGTLQVIRAGSAEAECRDGVSWVIYLASEDILSHTGMNEIRYGTWSRKNGLRRARVQGSPLPQDHRDMIEEIIDSLEEHAENIPFPGIDYYEQWLLSEQQQLPLALLNTAIHRHEFNPRQTPYDWRPSQGIFKRYQSATSDITELITTMRQLAGTRKKAIWVRRDHEGQAFELTGERISNLTFPDATVQCEGFGDNYEQMTHDYINHDAPAILQILTLPGSLRRRLEQVAWQQPRRVAELYRFYPQVIDGDGLKVALVKAKILGERKPQEGWHEPFLPFGNE